MNEALAPTQGLKGVPWSHEEHAGFLLGLEKLGKGNWRGISRTFVPTRTPTQVASHAQKYFLRAANGGSKRKSRFCGVTATHAASQPTKVARTAGSPLTDSCSPSNSQHRAAASLQQLPQHKAPVPQTLPITSTAPLNVDAVSHIHSPSEASCKASPSAAAAVSSLPFAQSPTCPTLGVPMPVHLANSQHQAHQEGSDGGAGIRPTVYGVPCFPMLPSSSLMGCVLPGLLPLNMPQHNSLPQHRGPQQLNVLPSSVSALLGQQLLHEQHEQQQQLQQQHEQQQRLQQHEQHQQRLQQHEQQHQQQCAADLSFGPLHTLALASADVAKEDCHAADEPTPKAAPVKQEEGSASPAASNMSNDSSCSNHSTHDSTFLSAALRAGLCRPEPVRGCSAQASSLLASLQPSTSASFYSCASSGALAAMDSTKADSSTQQHVQPQQRLQQVHVLGGGRPSAFRPIGKRSLAC